MRVVASLLHLLTGGILLFLGWLLSAALFSVLPVTRPLARSSLQLALLCLWPAGKEAVREADLERFQTYVRTGEVRHREVMDLPRDPVRMVQIALWIPVGAILAVGHLLHAVIQALPALSNPWESRSVALLRIAAWPLGWRVVSRSPARWSICPGAVRLEPDDGWSSPLIASIAARIAGPTSKLAGAAIVLWASGSGDTLFSPPALADRMVSPAYYPPYANWVRPARAPAVPVSPPVALPPVQRGCAAQPAPAPSALRLSRRPAEYALPLGSRPIPVSLPASDTAVLPHVQKLQLFAAAKRHEKLVGPVCRDAVAAKIERSAAYAAEVERIRRLAQKLDPDLPVWQASLGVPPIDRPRAHLAEAQAVAHVGRWLTSDPDAKSRAAVGAERAEAKVARAASLAARLSGRQPLQDT